jgi:hypothetical protein
MPRVSFESTTPVFEQAKTDYAFGSAAIVIGTPGIINKIVTIYRDVEELIVAHLFRTFRTLYGP